MHYKNLKYLLAAILFLLSTAAFSQQKMNDYTANWKKVEDLEKKGLTKSAKEEVLKIYDLAFKSKQDAEQIKASMYLIKYRNMVEEDSHENNIFYIDTLIEKANTPVKNILQSMQAEMFWQYLQNNRWKFYNRTQLVEEKSKDIATWSIEKLHATITALYSESLKNTELLKTTRIENYDPVIIKGENTRNLRPTLYDFLAYRALGYFTNDERDIARPAYAFSIKDEKSFAPADEFIKYNFKTKDTASVYYKAILLYQDILQFHLRDAAPDALIDADLLRLSFMDQKSVLPNKEKLYETALENIEKKYPNNAAAAQASYLKAMIYYNQGQAYDPISKKEHQYDIKKAKEICEQVIQRFSKSEAGINSSNLVNSILQPYLELQTEQVNVIGQAFRTLVSYQNTNRVYLRIIKTTREEIKRIDQLEYDNQWPELTRLKTQKEWNVSLPDLQDYQKHATEIKIDALNNGVYILLASKDAGFSMSKNIMAKQVFYASNISLIHNSNNYYVVHRDNGQPLANTKVQVWENKYNYNSRRYEENKMEQYTADANGYFKLKETKDYRTINLQINTQNDELFLPDNFNSYDFYSSNAVEVIKPVTFLFTDRSIYRPGQTVFFKGIVVKTDRKNNKSEIVTGFKTTILLKDANSQKLQEIEVTSNEFGSFNGSFKLPEGLLNGQFSLTDNITSSADYFSVEEYKRPKYMVEVSKPKGTYRVNDNITVTGTAKAYAGNNIDGAKVKYRVVRKVRYPIWWDWGYSRKRGGIRYPNSGNSSQEINNGETTTDAKGEFKITFKAIPDETVDKTAQPTFYYEVSADVTDINGETRSGSTAVAVAYQALQLNIIIDGRLPADSLKNLIVRSTNLNDIEEKTIAVLTIEKLKSPDKIFRERYWDQPDQFIMSKEEYYKLFPYDVYNDENEVKNFPVTAKVEETTDSTNSKFNIQHSTLEPGWYRLTAATKDKYGEAVTAIKYIQLTDSKGSTADKEAVTVEVKKRTAEPGESIFYTISSSFDKIWLIHNNHFMQNRNTTTYETLSNNSRTFNIAVSEADRGGIAMDYAFVKHNRVYDGAENFGIPWSNKELDITYNTFRDKLLPGENEKWGIKISGSKGEKLAAEMLATMYDASLDQFKQHNLNKLNGLWPNLYTSTNWDGIGFTSVQSTARNNIGYEPKYYSKSYDQLNGFGGYYGMYYRDYDDKSLRIRGMASAAPVMADKTVVANMSVERKEYDAVQVPVYDSLGSVLGYQTNTKIPNNNTSDIPVKIRKNFNETAFFFPDLKTDAEGNVEFSFTIPEALTQWKLMMVAHTKDLAVGYSEKSIVTQKQLMLQPNAPRFLREGDQIEFSSKVVNLTEKEVTGQVTLELLDAATNKPVDGWFKNIFPVQYFTAAAGQSTAVKFPIEIPNNFNSALTWRLVAKADKVSDGEEAAMPVLINRMLVTETMPLNLRNTDKKDFKFEKLLNSAGSNTLSNHALTVEFTSNPAWYAVQSLPYLMEYPYDCAEQTFNRYYANALAGYISNSIPRIKTVFEKWKNIDTAALLSNLEKNQELKSALLEETPWVMAAQNETQQKKNIALLFDMIKMSAEMDKAMNKLKELQSSNGGFVWFQGGPDDRYMTQYIITGIGHLRKLNALNGAAYDKVKSIVDRAIPYLDIKIKEEYDNLLRYKIKLSDNNLSSSAIQYLYMRSFFPEYKIAAASKTAYDYYNGQAKQYWLSQSKYMQGMIALALFRNADSKTAAAILRSLKENSIVKEELGMYWKEFATGGYYWYQSPIESQALMIEAFSDIEKNVQTVDDLKTWLLKNKQTTNWKTTRATAEACYALLLNGSNWLSSEPTITIQLGSTIISSNDNKTEAGTGYFKQRIEADKVKPSMGNITVTRTNQPAAQTAWGSVYWQYFEDLDKITSAETPLKLNKKLFIETNSDKGPVLTAIKDGDAIKIGDKIKVRIELRVDRDMEYVHMKDMRAACMEPVNVLSGYKYQGGLGYYESTKDASTNFFFGWLSRGTYVFEYPMFVTHAGNFSNGITTIQCMYAPEFTSHSEGVRVSVEDK